MKNIRIYAIFTAIITLFYVLAPVSAVEKKDDYNIVILHSYEKGNVWTEKIDKTFKEKLNTGNNSVVFYSEYLDSKRFFGKEYDQKLLNLYKAKFKQIKVNLLVITDDYAFDFALKNRGEIFNNAPIIFSGINGYDKDKVEKYKREAGITGVVETFDIEETIEMALQIHSNSKKIYIINTMFTPSGRYLKKQFVKAIDNMKLSQEVIYIEDLDMKDVYKRSESFEKDSIVLFGAYARDRSGKYYTFTKNMNELSHRSSRPIYGFLGFYMKNGLVGGYLTNGTIHGTEIARMASEYIEGKEISDIAIIEDSINELVFDYEQLQRFDIDISRLPYSAKIIRPKNKFLRLYNAYKNELIALLAFFVCLLICFIVLLYFFEQQRRLKEELVKANERLEERVTARTVQLVRQQSKVINTARLASIGEMASGIAHEINNPLAIIDLSSNRIAQNSVNEDVKTYTVRISNTVNRISKIIKGLKHLAKNGEEAIFEDFNIYEALEDVTSLCFEKFRENSIDISIDVDKNIKVFGSITQIAQVILNLLNNAFDELVDDDKSRWVKIVATKGEDSHWSYVEISITDSGKGISKKYHEEIFEPFFTTKLNRRGTGLGLSISKNIIRRHRGEFFLDKDSVNTRFVIRLPIS